MTGAEGAAAEAAGIGAAGVTAGAAAEAASGAAGVTAGAAAEAARIGAAGVTADPAAEAASGAAGVTAGAAAVGATSGAAGATAGAARTGAGAAGPGSATGGGAATTGRAGTQADRRTLAPLLVRRMPSWTYGPSGAAVSASRPTASPSATTAPFVTAIEPSWVSVTDQPSDVSIVTDLPLPGHGAREGDRTDAGARTSVARRLPPISTPRCCPAAYGLPGRTENGCQDRAVGRPGPGGAAGAADEQGDRGRAGIGASETSVVWFENGCSSTVGPRPRRLSKEDYKALSQRAAVEVVSRQSVSRDDDLDRHPARRARSDEVGDRSAARTSSPGRVVGRERARARA